MEKSRNSKLAVVSTSLCLAGLTLACMYANNDILVRIALPSILIGGAAILSLIQVFLLQTWERVSPLFILLLLIGGYFVLRAQMSPIGYFADKDTLLFLPALLSAFIFSLAENRRLLAHWLPWLLCFLAIIQWIPLTKQWGDPGYVPFRGFLDGKEHISGFFGHRNFFALLMGICSIGLLMYVLVLPTKSKVDKVQKLIWGIVALLGFFFLYWSSSRGAWVSVTIGASMSLLLFLVWRVKAKMASAKNSLVVGLSIFLVGGAGLTWLGLKMAESRSLEEGFFFANSRNELLLTASDCEPQNEIVGGGARFFSYEARRVWDKSRLYKGLGDSKSVHNEYVEALVNYGYVGMLLLMMLFGGLVVVFVWSTLSKGAPRKLPDEARWWVAMQMCMLAATVAIMVQSMVDFSLHVLPIIIFLGIASGLALRGKLPVALAKAVMIPVLAAVALLVWVGLPYWSTFALEERARSEQAAHPVAAAEKFLEAGKKSGSFEATYNAAQLFLQGRGSAERAKKAAAAYKLASEQHPFHGGVWIMRARLSYDAHDYKRALEFIETAVELVGNSEPLYGASHWQAIITYVSKRSELVTAGGEIDNLRLWRKELKIITERMSASWTAKFRPKEPEVLVEYEARAIFAVYSGRIAAYRAQQEGLSGNFARSKAYALYAREQYRKADAAAKGYKQEQDLLRIVFLRQQLAYMKKKGVSVDEDLLKSLENGEVSP